MSDQLIPVQEQWNQGTVSYVDNETLTDPDNSCRIALFEIRTSVYVARFEWLQQSFFPAPFVFWFDRYALEYGLG